MVTRVAFVLTALITLPAIPALGQEQDPREIQAQENCLSGKTEAGVALLAKLYAATGNANFIYNQARCYEQAARPDDAINRFREYLRVAKDVSAADKADVEKHIADCRALKAEQDREKEKHAAAAVTVNTKPSEATPPTPSPAVSDTTPGALDLSAQPTAESTPIYKKWWFWTGIGAVIAAGAVTAVLLLKPSNGACDGASHTCLGVK